MANDNQVTLNLKDLTPSLENIPLNKIDPALEKKEILQQKDTANDVCKQDAESFISKEDGNDDENKQKSDDLQENQNTDAKPDLINNDNLVILNDVDAEEIEKNEDKKFVLDNFTKVMVLVGNLLAMLLILLIPVLQKLYDD